MSERPYSNKKLEELAHLDLIWPKKSNYYRDILRESLKNKGWNPNKLADPDESSDIVHEQLWWDVCEIVNDLAQLVIDEREKRIEIRKELYSEFKTIIKSLK